MFSLEDGISIDHIIGINIDDANSPLNGINGTNVDDIHIPFSLLCAQLEVLSYLLYDEFPCTPDPHFGHQYAAGQPSSQDILDPLWRRIVKK